MKDDYLFAVSRVRVFEKKMLTYSDFLSLASKKTYTEVVDELVKRGYLKPGVSPKETLSQKEIELGKALKSSGIYIPNVFFLENDFFNIEATAKAVYKGINPEPLLKNPSSEKSRNLHHKNKRASNDKYTVFFKKALQLLTMGESCEEYIKNKLTETGVENSKNKYFVDWFSLIHRLKTPDVKNENIKIDYLKSHKYDTFSIAPIFGFYYGSLIEFRNIRTVLSGKKAGATKADITERLCNTYV